MTCRDLIGSLGAYLEGDLSPDVGQRFEEHLAGCQECTGYLETYRRTVKLAKDACSDPDGPLPPEVSERLKKAVLAARRKA